MTLRMLCGCVSVETGMPCTKKYNDTMRLARLIVEGMDEKRAPTRHEGPSGECWTRGL